jgi:DNA invertase Pin-like site-specific DNA recombinase
MKNYNIVPDCSIVCNEYKNKQYQSQFKATYQGFFKQPQTMKELSIATGIDRSNVCRYIREMRKANTIAVYKKGYCSITKHLANYYTTDPSLFPKSNQLKLL